MRRTGGEGKRENSIDRWTGGWRFSLKLSDQNFSSVGSPFLAAVEATRESRLDHNRMAKGTLKAK